MATGLDAYTSLLGDSESGNTILTNLTGFQGALGLLSVSPSDSATQRGAVDAAQGLAVALNRAGDELAATMTRTGDAISSDVGSVNARIARLQDLNDRLAGGLQGEARLATEDAIGTELDALAEVIDFTMRTDAQGRVEVFTTGGTELLAGNEAQALRYDAQTGTLFAGAVEITPGKPGVRGISEGSLAGRIAMASDALPQMQAQLDEVASALIETMAAVDISTGGPGLFTDAGAMPGVPYEPGLAARIAVNTAVLPDEGGAVWRIRDGMGAAQPGNTGDNTLIEDMIDALDGPVGFDEAAGLGGSATIATYASTLIAGQNATRARAETEAATLASGAVAVQGTRMSFQGVNVDDELQQLTQIQQSYAANAQVLQTVAEMLDTLIAAA